MLLLFDAARRWILMMTAIKQRFTRTQLASHQKQSHKSNRFLFCRDAHLIIQAGQARIAAHRHAVDICWSSFRCGHKYHISMQTENHLLLHENHIAHKFQDDGESRTCGYDRDRDECHAITSLAFYGANHNKTRFYKSYQWLNWWPKECASMWTRCRVIDSIAVWNDIKCYSHWNKLKSEMNQVRRNGNILPERVLLSEVHVNNGSMHMKSHEDGTHRNNVDLNK